MRRVRPGPCSCAVFLVKVKNNGRKAAVRFEHDEDRRIAFRLALQVILQCSGLVGFDCRGRLFEKLFDLERVSVLWLGEVRLVRWWLTRSALPALGLMMATMSMVMMKDRFF